LVRLILHGVIYLMSVLAVHAQGRAAPEPRGEIHALLHSRFDAAVRSTIPAARFESVPLEESRDYEYLRWRVGEYQRDVRFYVMHTAKEAQQKMSILLSSIAVANYVLDGVGDEGVVISANAEGYQRVIFRRGRIILHVGSPLAQDVVGFAKLLDTQVQRATRAAVPEP
jgi:hypothetical protein